MRKKLSIILVVIVCATLGFGISPKAESATMYQQLPCWKKKGDVWTGAGFLYCPKFIITLSCNYIDDYYPDSDSSDNCNFDRE